jgi:catechol 2,3-dioxygenase-like lactoylglutathione lyase family enzyme
MPVSTPVQLKTIGYVILYVKDAKKTAQWYSDTLGIPVKFAEDGWAELETSGTTLALHGHDKLPSKRDDAQPITVFNVEDIHGTYEALKQKGVKFEKEPHEVCAQDDFVGLSTDFTDPDGNKLSIYGKIPKK